MTKYKNTILIIISCILFFYTFFITAFPKIKTNSFSRKLFEKQAYEATSLITNVDSVEYSMKPNFETTITARNVKFQYIDYQDLFSASEIKIITTPAALFDKHFDIKEINMKRVKYSDQILPDGNNKLKFLPAAIDTTKFGQNYISITAAPINIKHLEVEYITPTTYDNKKYMTKSFSKEQVEKFLKAQKFYRIQIK